MALQHLRSGTANKRPIPTAMSDGQLAVNTNLASPGLFFKDSNGDLVKAGPVHVGTTAPNASPASTAATALVANTVYQILTVGTSDFTAVGASANTVGVVFTATGTTTGTGTVSGQQGVEKGEQWLDTTNSLYVMKVYDGTGWRVTDSISLANGSAAAPSLHFGSDTNTGLFRSAADSLAITTAGTQRVVVGAAGGVGIGVVPPSYGTGRNSLDIHSSGATVTHLGLTNSTTGSNGASNGFNIIQNGLNTLLYLRESGFMSFSTANTERLRIDSSGRLGLGTSSPGAGIHIATAGQTTSALNTAGDINLLVSDTGASAGNGGSVVFGFNSGSGRFAAIKGQVATGGGNSIGDLAFSTRNATSDATLTERLRILSNGNIGIGTSSPSQLLTVAGVARFENFIEFAGSISTPGTAAAIYRPADNNLAFSTASSERMRIDSSGRVGIGTTSPEEILHIAAASETVGSRDGVILQSTSSAAADTGLPLVFTADIGGGFTSYGLASIAGRKETGTVNGSDAAGYLQFATGSTGGSISEKMRIDSSGRLLVGTTTEGAAIADNLTVADSGHSGITIRSGTSSLGSLYFSDGTSGAAEYAGFVEYNHNGNYLGFGTGSTSRLRIDSSGRLLVGTSTAPSAGNAQYSKLVVQGNTYASTDYGILNLQRGLAASSGITGTIGGIHFSDNTGNEFALIQAVADGTTASNDYPGRLTFSTTADGASSPTERLRIDSSGNVFIGGTTASSADIALNANGRVESGFNDNTTEGVRLDPAGIVNIRRDSGTSTAIGVFSGGVASASTQTVEIKANGSITAAGNIVTGNDPGVAGRPAGIRAGFNGTLQIAKASGEQGVVIYKTGTDSAQIELKTDGSATFASSVNLALLRVVASGTTYPRIIGTPDGTLYSESSAGVYPWQLFPSGAATFAADASINSLTIGRGAGNVNGNSAFGYQALNSNTTGYNNVANGYQALNLNTTGSNNVATGLRALYSNTTAADNVASGYEALRNNTTGYSNVATGREALRNNTTGFNNVAVGPNTLKSNTTAAYNTAIGSSSLQSNTTGTGNTANGLQALYSNTTASYNVAVGYQALRSNTTGASNVASGYTTLYANTTGNYNTAYGHQSMRFNTTGTNNVANGYAALYNNTTGNYNVATGYEALKSVTTGIENTGLGTFALKLNTGNSNTAVGYQSLAQNTTATNNTAVGTYSLYTNSTGGNNVATGYGALQSNTTGSSNVANGYYALNSNTTGHSNLAIGASALQSNTTGVNNISSGSSSLYNNTTGSNNIAYGNTALLSNTTGQQNVAISNDALRSNTTGNYNIAIGLTALNANTTASNNVAIGRLAGRLNTTGSSNTAVGSEALYYTTTGSNNVAIGRQALFENSTGAESTASGYKALYFNTTGGSNVAFGAYALYNCSTGSGNIGIGAKTSANIFSPVFNVTTESNRLVLGHTSITNAYVKVSWTVTSDERDKMNFAPVPYGLDFVNQLKPTAYQFKVDRDTEEPNGDVRYGFKAQDILALEGDNPVIIDTEDADHLKYKGEHLVPVLVNAVQELTAMVKELQDEVAALKSA